MEGLQQCSSGSSSRKIICEAAGQRVCALRTLGQLIEGSTTLHGFPEIVAFKGDERVLWKENQLVCGSMSSPQGISPDQALELQRFRCALRLITVLIAAKITRRVRQRDL